MPKVAYSEQEREHIRASLIATGLALMSQQGIQHTTVEQIYKEVGISRTFFYSFFPTKEELIVEALYLQQPKILAYAHKLMDDPDLSWRQGVETFLFSCCYGEKNGIAVLTIEQQQQIFGRLSQKNRRIFREKQFRLFSQILECFGIRPERERISLFINLSLAVMTLRRAIPHTLPMLIPEAVDETVSFQIRSIVDFLEGLRNTDLSEQ
ncbi:TetR/AcrR family transcriptional regulator [uncultured Ruthenibacterium sp.]|uniref:TetR/AcrR family transcriptional regulator n=1 Tax=uncultured Ruthenibacterium sp. TaxID=1905347 RepID=UPI00349E6150